MPLNGDHMFTVWVTASMNCEQAARACSTFFFSKVAHLRWDFE
jgi:hypothetical protein